MKKGFTIVEMVLYAGLLVLFLAILSNLFLSSLDVKKASEGDSYTGQDTRFIISRLVYDIKRADSITSPVLGASAGSLTLSIANTNYTYASQSGKLVVTDASGTQNLESSETTLTNISFQRLGNVNGKNTIRVQLSINNESYVTTIGTR